MLILEETHVIPNYGNPQETISMVPLTNKLAITEESMESLIRCCNHPRVYERLFKSRLGSRPYGRAEAEDFIKWGTDGWREQSRFVFVLIMDDVIVGAVDVQSAEPRATIGYWITHALPGYMSNAVIKLREIAAGAGYEELYANINADNSRSRNVLLNAGFEEVPARREGCETFSCGLRASV